MHIIESSVMQFSQYLRNVGYGDTTQYTLPRLVKEFIEQQQLTDISCVSNQQVRSFYEYLQSRPLKLRSGALSESMIYHYVYALKTFFTWLEITEQIDYNPISGIKFKRPRHNKREPLSLEETGQLFKAAVTLKQRTLLHLCYSCGLRRSEAAAVDIRDIHFKERLLYVRDGKGAKRRVVPMTEKVTAELEAYYLNDRCSGKAKRHKDEEAFMLNNIGTRMSGDNYNSLLKRIVIRSAISKEITLHHLRHSIATHLLQSGMSIEYVKEFLGHSFLESTQIYARPKAEQIKLL